MARIARIALDIALVSIKTIRPAVTKLWRGSKSYIHETSAKRLVDNNLVTKAEYAFYVATKSLETKLTTLRNNQLPKEIKYLEKELRKAKEKMKNDKENFCTILATAKVVKPAVGTAWQYAKIEMAPPLTVGYLAGPGGRKIEEFASNTANNFIIKIESMVREIETEQLRQIKLKEEAAKAALQKLKQAEEKKNKSKNIVARKKPKTAKSPKISQKSKESKKKPKKDPPKKAGPKRNQNVKRKRRGKK